MTRVRGLRAISRASSSDGASTRAAWIGLLLGLGAATIGVQPPIAAIPLRPAHALFAAAFILAVVPAVAEGRSRTSQLRRQIRPVDAAFLLFILALLTTESINSAQLEYQAQVSRTITPTLWLMTYISGRLAIREAPDGARFARAFIAPIFGVAPIALLQVLSFPMAVNLTTSFVDSPGFEARVVNDSLIRAVGLVGGWTSFGGYVIVIAALSVGLLVRSREEPDERPWYPVAALSAAVVAALTTLTFTIIIVAVIVAIMGVRDLRHRIRIAIIFAIALIIGFLTLEASARERISQQFTYQGRLAYWLPEWMPNTIGYRIWIWTTETFPMIAERPLTGWGADVYEAAIVGHFNAPYRVTPLQAQWPTAESQWFGTMMTDGIVGLTALVFLYGSAYFIIVRLLRTAETRWIAHPNAWLLVATAVFMASTAISLTNKGFPTAFWAVMGVVAGLRDGQHTPPLAGRRRQTAA